ncbi:Cation channel sperm-associated protein 1 [Phlyctochytrium planicorne]|nr:Cation channel sperm-associated protein 1 [Phlyctochytrium planicorne]
MELSRGHSLFSENSADDYKSQYTSSLDTIESSQASVNVVLLRDIHKAGWIRKKVFDITQGPVFSNFILFVILMNSILLTLETMEYYKRVYVSVEHFAIVIVSIVTWLIPYLLSRVTIDVKIFRLLRLFRTVRAIRSLRVLRTISFLRSLQVILSTVLKSIPAMKNIFILSAVVLYAFAAFGTVMFQDVDPRRFGRIGKTFFRLFQVMAQDTWSSLYRDNNTKSWFIYYYVFFVVLVMHFIFLNLFVAVFVNNLQSARRKLNEQRKRKKRTGNDIDFLELEEVDVTQEDLKKPKGEDDVLSEGLFEEEGGIDNFYSPNLPDRLLAALDLNQQLHQRQMKVLDDLVDLANEQPAKFGTS